MKNLKPHELLKHAYENFPKRAKFTPFIDKGTYTSSGRFHLHEDDFNAISDEDNGHYIFEYGKWAEIVKPKIAVKVDNEKEFKALMKYYDWLGYSNPYMFVTFPEKRVKEDGFLLITFEDNYVYPHVHYGNHENLNPDNYQIIPFSDFSEQKGIKLPFLTSEDGVDLYDDSDIHIVWKYGAGWEYDNHHIGFKSIDGSWYVNPEIIEPQRKLFSTKHAALSWIDAQKPKEIEIHLPYNGIQNFTAIISDDKVVIKSLTAHNPKKVQLYEFNKSWIELIAEVIQK